jgi:hypothetical protein
VVKYHGLARRHPLPSRLLMRPLLNGGTLGGRKHMASVEIEGWCERVSSTGDIGPIRLGMSRERVRAIFGEPDDVGGTSRKRRPSAIWVYGGVEFHFDLAIDELFLIYRDTADGVVEISISRPR